MEEFLTGLVIGFLKCVGLYVGCNLIAQVTLYTERFSNSIARKFLLTASVLALAAFPAAMASDLNPAVSTSFERLWGQYVSILSCLALWLPKPFEELFHSMTVSKSSKEPANA